MNYPEIALQVPRIILPRPGLALDQWAVIACDQYTAQPQYWEKVKRQTNGAPSTLNLVFPEAYLEQPDRTDRIDRINQTMRQYLKEGALVEHPPGFVLVDRQTPHAASRQGLIVALDLEHFDYRAGAKTLIRSTEGTVVERLPPRIEVRRQASLELPHIMVLIDDPQHTVIEPLADLDLEPLYDTTLMLGGGRVCGWRVSGQKLLDQITGALAQLATPASADDQAPMLYAMGDGNHSFATAKEVWEDIKRNANDPQTIQDHPARHVLVELVNVHNDGLQFEPIHRVVFGAPLEDLLAYMEEFYTDQNADFTVLHYDNHASWHQARAALNPDQGHHLPFAAGQHHGILTVRRSCHRLEVATLQVCLDSYAEHRPNTRLDYIHGEIAVETLSAQPNTIGIYTRAIDKHALFRTVLLDGALPAKTFSLGEAEEKRYYLEARCIRP
jgi:hypothetical protein